MNTLEQTFLFISAVLTSTISGFVGMAGGILLLGAMTFVMPFSSLVPIHGLVQLTSNFTRSLILRKNIHKEIFLWFSIGTPFGGVLGYMLLSRINSPEWMLFFVVALLLYVVFKPKKMPGINLSSKAFLGLGVLAGGLGCLIGATGPLLAPFFLRKDLNKEQIVATKAACQIMIHIVKIPIFMALAFNYMQYWQLIVFMVIGVLVGTKIGTMILKRINGKQFIIYVKVAMALMAVRLTYKLVLMYVI